MSLRWALLRGIDETFRAAATNLQTRLDEAKATRGVIDQARVRRHDTPFAIDADVERLNRVNELLSMLRQQISKRRPHNSSVCLDLPPYPDRICLC
jgi:hypothetical protein